MRAPRYRSKPQAPTAKHSKNGIFWRTWRLNVCSNVDKSIFLKLPLFKVRVFSSYNYPVCFFGTFVCHINVFHGVLLVRSTADHDKGPQRKKVSTSSSCVVASEPHRPHVCMVGSFLAFLWFVCVRRVCERIRELSMKLDLGWSSIRLATLYTAAQPKEKKKVSTLSSTAFAWHFDKPHQVWHV